MGAKLVCSTGADASSGGGGGSRRGRGTSGSEAGSALTVTSSPLRLVGRPGCRLGLRRCFWDRDLKPDTGDHGRSPGA